MVLKIAVITGSSASGLACMQRLLSKAAASGSEVMVRGCYRMQGKAATTRSSLPLQGLKPHPGKFYESFPHVDASDLDSLRRALEGMDRALLVTPLDYRAGLQNDSLKSQNMIQIAQEMELERIVHIGSWTVKAAAGAPEGGLPILSSRFAPTEEYLKTAITTNNMEWTVLRGGYFMSNFAHVHGESIRSNQTMISVPECYIPPVDVQDIGHAAATLLLPDELDDEEFQQHFNHSFVECCGPELLNHVEIATKLSTGIGVSVGYTPIELKDWTCDNPIMSELYNYMTLGDGKQIPYDPEPFTKLVGRPLTTLEEWAQQNKHSFL